MSPTAHSGSGERRLQSWLMVLGVAITYFVVGRVGLVFGVAAASASPLWPAAGAGIAATLVFGPRAAIGVAMGSLATHLVIGNALVTACTGASGATLEALCGWWLLSRHCDFSTGFRRIQDVIALGVAALITPVLSASLGALGLALSGAAQAESLLSYFGAIWAGDTLGIFIVTPVVLVLFATGPKLSLPERRGETALLGAVLMALLVLAVTAGKSNAAMQIAIASVMLPVLVWAAIRLEPWTVALMLAGVVVACQWVANTGLGAFVTEPPWMGRALLDLPLVATALTTQIVWATNAQRREAISSLREHQRRFAAFSENANDMVTIVDERGVTQYVSPSIERILGLEPKKMLGHEATECMHRDDIPAARAALRALMEQPDVSVSVDLRHRRGDGGWAYLRSIGTNLIDRPGVNGLLWTSRDVTGERRSEQRIKLAMDGASDGLWEIEFKDRSVFASPRLYELLGYPRDTDLPLDQWDSRLHPDDRETLMAALKQHLDGKCVYLEAEFRVRAADGTYRWLQCRGKAARDSAGNPTRIAGCVVDINERKKAEERIEALATRDPLTGLPNRLLLADRVNQYVHTAKRTERGLALLFIDLDFFKTVNDRHGHDIGDILLRQLAGRLQHCVRGDDTLARLGGDEFVAVVQRVNEPNDVLAVVQKIMQEVAEPYEIGDRSITITCSIGIALYPSDGADVTALLKSADTAMYHAKQHGRQTYEFFSTEMSERAVTRLMIENALKRALERKEFVVHYQPILERGNGRLLAAEALIRWQHPERGLVVPAEFLAVAEETGIIRQIGEFVLKDACTQCRRWQRMGAPQMRVTVNMSVAQFRPDAQLRKSVEAALTATGLTARSLELDISESVLLQQDVRHAEMLAELSELGASIAIDDFGTGFSSLNYLHRLPINAVKIDRTFIRDLHSRRDDSAIVSAITALASSMGLQVIAEGVERAEQLEILERLRVDAYQGFLASAPLPLAQFEAKYFGKTDPLASRLG